MDVNENNDNYQRRLAMAMKIMITLVFGKELPPQPIMSYSMP
jgi:hypothetical protein